MDCPKIDSEVLVELPSVYAIGMVKCQGTSYVLAASELRNGAAYLINARTGDMEKIWDGPGGVMAMVGIGDNSFLSIDGFYPVFDSAKASVSLTCVNEKNGIKEFKKRKLFDLPWCHRVGFIRESDGNYIVAGTLCKEKKYVDDWTTRGSVYVGKFQNGEVSSLENVFPEQILKHHAMWIHDNGNGTDDVFVGGQEGTFRVSRSGDEWNMEKILDIPTSDIAVADFDGDGQEEIAIIEGFHGNLMKIFKSINGRYELIVSYAMEFGHVLWGGMMNGKESLILGTRGGEKFLRVLTLKKEGSRYRLDSIELDHAVGPAQIAVYQTPEGTEIFAADHGANCVKRYRREKERETIE